MAAVGQGRVYLVGAGPGDPGLITLKGIRCLQKADVVVHDRLINRSLLEYARQAEWIDVGKEASHHTLPQEEINRLLVEQAQAGRVVVRLKGGDPFVFGRGGEEAQALSAAGIPFEVVPGVTSAIAVPAYAGIPITHRGVAASAVLVTGHHAGCGKKTDEDAPDPLWQRAARGADTLVFLMGISNLDCIVEQLLESGRTTDTPVALIEQGASPFQQVAVGTLADICQSGSHIRPPAVIVVGEVVNLRNDLLWFDRPDSRPLYGRSAINLRLTGLPREMAGAWQDTGQWSLMFAEMGVESLDYEVACVQPVPDRQQLERVIDQMALGFGTPPAYDRIIFADDLAVSYFFQHADQLDCDARLLSTSQVAAAESTGERELRRHGIRPDLQLNCLTSRQILAHLQKTPGTRTLLLCSDRMNAWLSSKQNGKQGWVESVAVYSVGQGDPDPELFSRLSSHQADIVNLFSPAVVHGLAAHSERWAKAQGVSLTLAGLLAPFTVACLDPGTAEAAREWSVRVDILADTASPGCLSAALVQYWKEKISLPAAEMVLRPG